MKQIFLKYGKEESLLRHHPWVFSGAIHHFSEEPEEGEIVDIMAATCGENNKFGDFSFIARGHYQAGSIMVRILTFDNEPIDQTFYEQRLQSALAVRQMLGLNDSFRLVHGEGDLLPGLVIDVYGRTAVMQAHSVGMHLDRMTIAKALKVVMGDNLDNIYYKSETTLPVNRIGGEGENCYLLGGNSDDVASENGLKFHVDWLRGQKTGYFVDQRDNRSLLEKYANGRRVLNMFCYTGGFSFYALRGGAILVHSVDSSKKAIDLTCANVELNFPNDPRHEAFAEDAFKFLEHTNKGDYDLVILDPPAFAKHKSSLHNALKGYTRLNQRAMEKMPSGSILFTFSCSQVVSKDHFRAAVFTAAVQAGRKVRILHQLHQPADHPINICHPEGEYLKGLVLYLE